MIDDDSKEWGRIYAAAIVVTALVIVGLWTFSKIYS